MFSRTRPLLKILKISLFQKAFRSKIRKVEDHSGLENFLQPIIESPPKQNYSLAFFDEEVQGLLKKITNIDMEKTFRSKPRGQPLVPPTYKLLTDEELQAEMEKIQKKIEYLLQIPPLVNVTEDKVEVIESNTSLDGFDLHHSKHVFADISFDKTNANRAVVIREPNGVLRTASKAERFRVNQTYYPLSGREMDTPKMFYPEHLMDVIKRKDYEFILDRACAQFEPEDEDYHKVISITYNAINYCKDFKVLQSTRHYGSLAFYLVTHKNIDNMLYFHIEVGIDNASALVKLYHIIHPHCKSAELSNGKSHLESVKNFIEYDSNDKVSLEKILKTSLKKEKAKAKMERAVRKAHGLQN